MEFEENTVESSQDVARHSKHYLNHLADVGEEHRVSVHSDIYNTKGVLVARKGVAIDKKMSVMLAHHKLSSPVEKQTHIEGSITPNGLRNIFLELTQGMRDLRLTHERHGYLEEFNESLGLSRLNPALFQKLTVFLFRYPDALNQHLFCAWFAGLLAREMGMEERKSARIVVAALCRDLGLLHLDPAIFETSKPFTPQLWRAMESHTIVSKVIAEELGQLAPDQLGAILQHHERFDGMGYPRKGSGSRLMIEGQVIALADSIAAIRFKQFKSTGRSLRDTQAFVQMNLSAFHPDVYKAVFSIYKQSGLARTSIHTHGSLQDLVNHLKKTTQVIQAATMSLEKVMVLVNNMDADATAHQVMKSAMNVLQIIRRSGQSDPGIIQWLDMTTDAYNKDEIADLIEMELVQNELFWQLGNLRRNLQVFFSEHVDLADPQIKALQEHTQLVWSNYLSKD